MYISELTPTHDKRKSFYGKAHLIHLDNDTTQLQNYNTVICEVTAAGVFRTLWEGDNQTTIRHINEFRKRSNII